MKKVLLAILPCALTLSIATTPVLAAENNSNCKNQNASANRNSQIVRTLFGFGGQQNNANIQSEVNSLLSQLFAGTNGSDFTQSFDWSKLFSSKNCPTTPGSSSSDSSSEDSSSEDSSSSSSSEDSSSSSSSSSDDSSSSSSSDDGITGTYRELQKQVIEIVNEERAANGLAPLTENKELDKIATLKSEDMAKLNYFSHTSPTYGSPFEMLSQFGITYTAAGENIAMGQPTPESVMNAWMNSEGHRANILNKNYTQIGVGIAKNASGQYIWTQTFLRP